MVATLLDLTTGTPQAVASMLNKQQPFGADVITRISATMLNPAALDTMTDLAGRRSPNWRLRCARRPKSTRPT